MAKGGARVGSCSDLLPEDVTERVVTSPQLTCKPQAWITQLYEVALEANSHLVLQLVGQIPKTETHLIQSLTKLVRQFEF
jgi:hypothetical protein